MNVYISVAQSCPPLLCKLGSCVSDLLGAKGVEGTLHEPCNEHEGSRSSQSAGMSGNMLELSSKNIVVCVCVL